jgi:hypothetical protein
MIVPPKANLPQRLYGEIVYWVTIGAALICTVGPFLAMADKDRNVLDPHFLFANIFNGEKPEGVWALSSNKEVKLDVWTDGEVRTEHPGLGPREAVELLRALPRPDSADAVRPEFGIGERLRIVRLPASEVEEGREYLVPDGARKLKQAEARNEVLAVYSREVFSGGHFWADDPGAGDAFTQLGLALGCSVALWALLAVAFAYARERVWLYVVLSLWVAALVFLSAAGLIESH